MADKVLAVIPARMGSTRFPGKPLAGLLGKPMIRHVWERTRRCRRLAGTVIATCDREIARAAAGFGAEVVMTSGGHERASDRLAEAARRLRADLYVMVQGDEPMIVPGMIDEALAPFSERGVVCVNLAARIRSEADFADPNTIKVVMDRRGDALYFSRSPIPSPAKSGFAGLAAYKQVCVIPFRRDFLLAYARLRPTPLEIAESIDMLRALEHGYPVRLAVTRRRTQSVDTPADLARVERLMRGSRRP